MSNAKKYSLIAILLIPIGIAINFVGGQVATALKLPIFIDTIGTILVGALTGPVLGFITGILSNLLLGITVPSLIPYAVVNGAIGLVAGLCANRSLFTTPKKLVIPALLIWITAQITSIPITFFVFGGANGSGASIITAFFASAGQSLITAVTTSSLITETLDKFISVIIVYLVIKAIPQRTLSQFPIGDLYFAAKPAGAKSAPENKDEVDW